MELALQQSKSNRSKQRKKEPRKVVNARLDMPHVLLLSMKSGVRKQMIMSAEVSRAR